MLYAVTLEELGSIFFMSAPPGPGWDVQEGVELDIPVNYVDWLEVAERPRPLLGVSCTDPRHYKVFLDRRDLEPSGFQALEMDFGGFFSRDAWKRFAALLPAAVARRAVQVDEPPGATERAIQAIKRGR